MSLATRSKPADFSVATANSPTRMAAFFAPMSPWIRLRRVLVGSAATFVALAGTGLPVLAQKATTKPDHVLWRNQRGQSNTVVGTVTDRDLAIRVLADLGVDLAEFVGEVVDGTDLSGQQAVTERRVGNEPDAQLAQQREQHLNVSRLRAFELCLHRCTSLEKPSQ